MPVRPLLTFAEIAAALDAKSREVCAMPRRSYKRAIAEDRLKQMRTAAMRCELASKTSQHLETRK